MCYVSFPKFKLIWKKQLNMDETDGYEIYQVIRSTVPNNRQIFTNILTKLIR